jgi:hypothetical protein
MAVRLSALRTPRTLLPRSIINFMFLVLISVTGWVNPGAWCGREGLGKFFTYNNHDMNISCVVFFQYCYMDQVALTAYRLTDLGSRGVVLSAGLSDSKWEGEIMTSTASLGGCVLPHCRGLWGYKGNIFLTKQQLQAISKCLRRIISQ